MMTASNTTDVESFCKTIRKASIQCDESAPQEEARDVLGDLYFPQRFIQNRNRFPSSILLKNENDFAEKETALDPVVSHCSRFTIVEFKSPATDDTTNFPTVQSGEETFENMAEYEESTKNATTENDKITSSRRAVRSYSESTAESKTGIKGILKNRSYSESDPSACGHFATTKLKKTVSFSEHVKKRLFKSDEILSKIKRSPGPPRRSFSESECDNKLQHVEHIVKGRRKHRKRKYSCEEPESPTLDPFKSFEAALKDLAFNSFNAFEETKTQSANDAVTGEDDDDEGWEVVKPRKSKHFIPCFQSHVTENTEITLDESGTQDSPDAVFEENIYFFPVTDESNSDSDESRLVSRTELKIESDRPAHESYPKDNYDETKLFSTPCNYLANSSTNAEDSVSPQLLEMFHSMNINPVDPSNSQTCGKCMLKNVCSNA